MPGELILPELCCSTGLDGSRWYRVASDSLSRALILSSISGIRRDLTAADHRLSRCPVPPTHSWTA